MNKLLDMMKRQYANDSIDAWVILLRIKADQEFGKGFYTGVLSALIAVAVWGTVL